MPWWAWLVLGIGLLGAEMFVIDAQFYLVFIGLSAAVVGLLGLLGVDLPNWAQWLVFSALAVVAMFTFRRRLYEMVRNRGGHVDERLTVGDRVVVRRSPRAGPERPRRLPRHRAGPRAIPARRRSRRVAK